MVSFALIGHPLAFMQWTHASTAWRCGATRVAEVMRTRAPQEHVPWPRILAWLALIAQKASCTSFLAAVLRGMPAEARGSHGQPTDAAGCAAMPCEEVVVHGYDIARGLGVACTPPPDLARARPAVSMAPAGDP